MNIIDYEYINPFIPRNKVLHKDYIKWMKEADVEWYVGGTLTYRSHTYRWGEAAKRKLVEDDCRHYWNILDKKYYGSAAERFGVRIPRVVFIQHLSTNIHIHYIAGIPKHLSSPEDKASYLIKLGKVWRTKLRNAGVEVRISPLDDPEGWMDYIATEMKIHGKTDGVEVNSTHLGDGKTLTT